MDAIGAARNSRSLPFIALVVAGASVDGMPVLACNLRGRNLAGEPLPPLLHSCSVCRCRSHAYAYSYGLDCAHQRAGVRLPLPQDYAGAVLECRQRDAAQAAGSSQDAEAAAEAGPITTWAATAVFSHLHYYNHDAAPLRGDGLRRCLEWAELSALVHAPVDPAAVTAAIADGSAAQLRVG